jgi:hypothetical protein
MYPEHLLSEREGPNHGAKLPEITNAKVSIRSPLRLTVRFHPLLLCPNRPGNHQ